MKLTLKGGFFISDNASYALIDFQSVKTTYYRDKHGYDRGKKRKDESDT